MKDLKVFKRLQLMAAALGVGFVLSNPMVTFAEESVGDVLYEQETDEHEEVDIVENPEENEETKEDENTENNEETKEDENIENNEETKEDENNEETKEDENTEDTEKKEFGEDEFIDADNWSPEIDIDPNAGLEIPDTVDTEAERKHIEPLKPETPSTPSTPSHSSHSSHSSSTPETPTPVPTPIPTPQTGVGIGGQVALGLAGALVLAGGIDSLFHLWDNIHEITEEDSKKKRKKLR